MNDCTENDVMVDYIVSELLHATIPEENTFKKLCYEMERYICNHNQ